MLNKNSIYADALAFQERLCALYYDVTCDGEIGPETMRQASNFAFEHGLRADASTETTIRDDVLEGVKVAPQWARLVDLAKYQGDGDKCGALPDMGAIKRGGMCGAIIKAGGADDGLYRDPAFKANWTNAKNARLCRGAYFFHSFASGNTPEDQAEYFYKLVGGHDSADLPPCLDVEDRKSAPLSPADAIAHVRRTLERMRALFGVTPLLYTSAAALGARGIDSKTNGLEAYPLFVPRYPRPGFNVISAVAKSIPQCYPSKRAWALWQMGNSANMKGVNGLVDRNFFQGTEEQLAERFNLKPTFAAPTPAAVKIPMIAP